MIAAPRSESHQKLTGTTEALARSETIHWISIRLMKTACAARPKSATATTAVGKNARSNRRRLVALMRDANFRNYAAEWWHFTLQNEPFSSRRFDFPVK